MLLLEDRKKAKQKEKFNKQELNEITSYIPLDFIKSKRVIDIGAGIGRYTHHFASLKPTKVTAVDFVEEFIKKNEELAMSNNHISKDVVLEFLVSDVRNLKYQTNTFDLIFSNWLLMYINDDQVLSQFDSFHDWLSKDGYLFFRESCETTLSGLQGPAAFYRKKQEYNELLRTNGKFVIVKEGNVLLYEKKYNNPNQRWWLCKKI
jgi:phosphoethanolamine N-methyltransferase